ncbi:MAG: helix-turn-helix domain-containing protein [Chloroflexota bacterium]|nr:helix-turn-helix domain-containing protein [Euryarchaeota archaeon]MEA2008974.1 helix-turn-helix domain-containing protein [Chloroflexota bacterium]
MKKEIVKRYSQAFRQQVVREYEAGTNVNRLQQKYGIGGSSTIQRWIKKYSHAGLRSEMMIIQSPEDQLEFKAMKSHIVELEAALAESVLESRMLKATLEVAGEALGMDLKKNFGKTS